MSVVWSIVELGSSDIQIHHPCCHCQEIHPGEEEEENATHWREGGGAAKTVTLSYK